ncbi:MAG: hypothetical protein JSS59_14205 [Proteobacteria bacterium]|nr:hypothetical protein [Pseudomonadota bacterium]
MLTGGDDVQAGIDIFGCFCNAAVTALSCTCPKQSATISPGGNGSAITVACPAASTLTGGSCDVANGRVYMESSKRVVDSSGQRWQCYYTNVNGPATTFAATANCCSVR